MIITISGMAGSGKSTVARLLARKLGFRHYSAGDFMRELARKKAISLLEISRIAEKDVSIDRELDDRTVKLAKSEDEFVMDSRLGFHFIPGSFKVFLTVDEKEAAGRIYKDVKGRKENRQVEKESKTLASTLAGIRKRKASEIERYRKYYSINPFDEGNYDLVIDTTSSTPGDVAAKIAAALKDKTAEKGKQELF